MLPHAVGQVGVERNSGSRLKDFGAGGQFTDSAGGSAQDVGELLADPFGKVRDGEVSSPSGTMPVAATTRRETSAH
ncbi:hypothetical protein K2224_12495 [Streptomyces sp. BHT-5-2]|uniref:hypothetical protein n=1 Tax=Streptomyces sp. BHT-5-2 TaxID=2866715 RepID=UPI001C8DCB1B|nr:hypothetical protein K2224_12495 [Streptomyces sp. BHT-5-2]